MDPSFDARAKQIFDQAIDLTGEARLAAVVRACGGDQALQSRVESLLSAVDREDPFLSDPTLGLPADLPPTPSAGSLASERPGSRIGPYKLLELIGEGGFGSVFMAEQTEPVRRRVALKIIKLGMDTRAVVARFEQERQALALMDHPGIAKVFDGGATETGRPYFVMELVRGEPITQYCDRANLSIEDRLGLLVQVCRAVQHAHAKGIIHRDLKPGNILVSEQDGSHACKIIDFGIAKATSQPITEKTVFTEFRQMIGTPEYMSPEQAGAALDIDTRSDVYSLGVLMYELLAGVTPFDARQLRSAAYGEIQRIIREVDPPAPSTRLGQSAETLARVAAARRTEPRRLGSIIRGELDWIVMKAMEKDRSRRYDTPGNLAADIERYLGGQPVLAAPAGLAYAARKFMRRHRVGVTAAALVAAALLVGSAGATAGLIQARRQRDRARTAEAEQAVLRTAAEKSEAAMKLQAERSETVALFVTDILRGVQPAVAQGRDTSIVREMLDESIVRLDRGELRDEPLVEADVRHVVGVVLSDLGLADRAISMHREALRLRIAAEGEACEDVALSLNDLGKALWRDGQYDEAERVLRRALEIRTRLLPADHPYLATSMNNLGMLLKQKGDLPGAESMMREALNRNRRAHGDASEETANTLANLSTILHAQNKTPAALDMAREALATRRRLFGPNHPALAISLENTAGMLEALDRPAESEPLRREQLAICRAVYEPGHPLLANAAENLAICLQHQCESSADAAKAQEALTLFDEALGVARKGGAKLARDQARILLGIARTNAAVHNWSAAAGAYRETDRVVQSIADAHPSARPTLATELAEVYAKWDAAEPGHGHDAEAAAWRRKAQELAAPPPAVPR